MPVKNKTSTTTSLRPWKGMDQAMKAGLAAIGCSLLIVALSYLAMNMFPIMMG
jgi:hypothetical protein